MTTPSEPAGGPQEPPTNHHNTTATSSNEDVCQREDDGSVRRRSSNTTLHDTSSANLQSASAVASPARKSAIKNQADDTIPAVQKKGRKSVKKRNVCALAMASVSDCRLPLPRLCSQQTESSAADTTAKQRSLRAVPGSVVEGVDVQQPTKPGIDTNANTQPQKQPTTTHSITTTIHKVELDVASNSRASRASLVGSDCSTTSDKQSSTEPKSYKKWRQACLSVVNEMRQLKNAFVFEDPVLENEDFSIVVRQQYRRLIKQPMDYATIQKRLGRHHARTFKAPSEFATDMHRVYRNCVMFNPPDKSNLWIHQK